MESEGIAALRWLVSGSCASSGSNRGVLIMTSLHRILKKAPDGALFNMAEEQRLTALRLLVFGCCASYGSNRRVLIMASLHRILKKAPDGALFNMAEEQGFEPWEPRGSLVFKTSAFDHSATPPITCCVSGPCR